MKNKLLLLVIITFTFTACEKAFIPKIDNQPQAIFDELWRQVDENYIYFDLKGVDWTTIYDEYAPLIKPNMTEAALFTVCSDMLKELRDGHNVLRKSSTQFSAYNFKEGYDIPFDLKVIKERYLKNTFEEIGFFTYGILNNTIGYIHYADFENARQITAVMDFMRTKGVTSLIFDVRNNGGGSGAEDILPYFIPETTNVGYTIEKTGKGHQEVSEPLSFFVQPADYNFGKRVVVLTNRGSFSATSYFAGMMKHLAKVTLVGQITGGGGGGNATFELPNGWLLSVSVSTFLDTKFVDIEPGVKPDIAINNEEERLKNGIDDMLVKALEVLQN